jgi:asparagine synthase (glutamine-hydrolysing)
MCGIAGFIYNNTGSNPIGQMNKMLEQMLHRGPDDWGITCIDNVNSDQVTNKITHLPSDQFNAVLGHRRLSIIDLSENGRQPMISADGNIAITFNGEIYNYIELREELKKSYRFRTDSDTEVLLFAYKHWGIDMLNKLNGMFAFAIWDKEKNKLLCARDPIGIKPFYYTTANGQFAFASEPRPLLSFLNTSGHVNHTIVSEFLVLGVSDHSEDTFFSEVSQLPGGQFMEVSADSRILKQQTYWDVTSVKEKQYANEQAVKDAMDFALRNSVKLHMRSDVPVGSALSGGIDSSTIVHLTSQLLGSQASGYKCLTISNPGFKDDESEMARLICEKTGTQWIPVEAQHDDIATDFPKFIRSIGEPFSNMTMYAQYNVMKYAAREGLKVMVDGQGGDELFIGYDRVAQRILVDHLTKGHLVQFFSEWLLLKKHANLGLAQSLMSNLYFNLGKIAIQRRSSRISKLVNTDLLHQYRPETASEVFQFSGIKKAQRLELKKYALPRLLKYEDRNSMAFHIESRVPFVSKDLLETGLSLPAEWLVHNGWTKYPVRATMDKRLPDSIMWNPVKRGFDIPEKKWLGYLQPSLKTWIDSLNTPLINKEVLMDEIQKAESTSQIRALWPVLSLALWLNFENVSS